MSVVSVWDEKKPEDILYSEIMWLRFLALFLLFLPYFPPSCNVYGLGYWHYKLDFHTTTKLPFLRKVSKKPWRRGESSRWHFKSVMPSTPASDRPRREVNGTPKEAGCHNRDSMLCTWGEAGLQFLVSISSESLSEASARLWSHWYL